MNFAFIEWVLLRSFAFTGWQKNILLHFVCFTNCLFGADKRGKVLGKTRLQIKFNSLIAKCNQITF